MNLPVPLVWYRLRVALCAALVTIVSYYTYVSGYDEPKALFWDENYHIASAQHYLNRDFFMEPHPPLGKLLIALGEHLLAPNEKRDQFRDVEHGDGSQLPEEFSFAGYRLIPTILAWLTAPLLFLTAFLISNHLMLALVAASLYTFDNAIIVHSRAAMLEGVQIFFVSLALFCFFAIKREEGGRRLKLFLAVVLGAALGAAIATKVNALIFLVLIPLMAVSRVGLRLRLQYMLCVLVSMSAVYCTVWCVHFSLAQQRNPKLNEEGYYTKDPAVRRIIDQKDGRSLGDFVALFKANSIDYLAHYSKGVPILNLCKPDENGSPSYFWPLGGRTIQYRWETAANNTAKYLYLVPNPVGWGLGALSVAVALALLVARLVFPEGVRLKRPSVIVLLVALYVGYLVAIGPVGRVLYLYHYFLPLIVSYLLYSVLLLEVERVGPLSLAGSRKSIVAAFCIIAIFAGYQWYAPLTYYKPISDREISSRARLSIWDLRCAGCPRTNYLAREVSSEILTSRFTISGLSPSKIEQGWGQPRLGFSVVEKSNSVRGIAYANSFGMHSNAEMVYPVDKRVARFTADVGLPDYVAGTEGSVKFVVEGDGRIFWEGPIMRGGDPVVSIDLDISGVETLSLKILDGGDGITHDHGFWANPVFNP